MWNDRLYGQPWEAADRPESLQNYSQRSEIRIVDVYLSSSTSRFRQRKSFPTRNVSVSDRLMHIEKSHCDRCDQTDEKRANARS